ncbi:hypothetical protein CBS101457_002684 [Exobasidium rhododendri]|nr:hypothetical protein CBS101457_002684 [Exobasidium rhododendri]
MLTRQLLSSVQPTKQPEEFVSNVDNTSSAIEHALNARCSESEDSSDDSYTSDDSVEEDCEEIDLTLPLTSTSSLSSTAAPRRPTSLAINSHSDRRVSASSQRSPLSLSSTRSLSSHSTSPIPSPRTPSLSMRHDAALRSFQKKRDQESQSTSRACKQKPSVMDISSIQKIAAPSIEIVQVYDDCDTDEDVARSGADTAKADRSAARKRMMSTLGRGQSKSKAATATLPISRRESRRVPSLDQLSTLLQSKSDEAVEVKTPLPKTPGTASPFHHQRNLSCPTPTSPYGEQYGDVQVFVTPPTPRPQGPPSPMLGYELVGFSNNKSSFRSSCKDLLAAPAFDLAPGKQRVMEAQKANAAAWLASWQKQQDQLQQLQQQQVILASMQQSSPNCYDLMTMNMINAMGMPMVGDTNSPKIVPGTPGAPSMIHIQQQKAILAQQQMMIMMQLQSSSFTNSTPSRPLPSARSRGATKIHSASSTNSSWWRGTQSNTSSSSSASPQDNGANSSGPADTPSVWRRKDSSERSSSPEKVKSTASLVYVPPGKRAAMKQYK